MGKQFSIRWMSIRDAMYEKVDEKVNVSCCSHPHPHTQPLAHPHFHFHPRVIRSLPSANSSSPEPRDHSLARHRPSAQSLFRRLLLHVLYHPSMPTTGSASCPQRLLDVVKVGPQGKGLMLAGTATSGWSMQYASNPEVRCWIPMDALPPFVTSEYLCTNLNDDFSGSEPTALQPTASQPAIPQLHSSTTPQAPRRKLQCATVQWANGWRENCFGAVDL